MASITVHKPAPELPSPKMCRKMRLPIIFCSDVVYMICQALSGDNHALTQLLRVHPRWADWARDVLWRRVDLVCVEALSEERKAVYVRHIRHLNIPANVLCMTSGTSTLANLSSFERLSSVQIDVGPPGPIRWDDPLQISVLPSLPSNIERLTITGRFTKWFFLVQNLERLEKLEMLDISHVLYMQVKDLDLLIECLVKQDSFRRLLLNASQLAWVCADLTRRKFPWPFKVVSHCTEFKVQFTDTIPAKFADFLCVELRSLRIISKGSSGFGISPAALQSVSYLKNLQKLSFVIVGAAANVQIQDKDLISMISGMQHLKILNFQVPNNLTTNALIGLGKVCRGLSALRLSGHFDVQLLENEKGPLFPKLSHLLLEGPRLGNDTSMSRENQQRIGVIIRTHAPALRYVGLQGGALIFPPPAKVVNQSACKDRKRKRADELE
ncbi:hypothetical protein K470DRAFT_295317 [Piedraia hortae CBS 480.64]|uniref:F-box domain-containing protein n=1 Tax=Piedraia hortae CBS 480.64 TaxID=1314780 RepID=A0A6A7BXP3_9PEZI|nr:hypothetical protein K470DRAFT_295317 [Piedraia hortae CBS 480.64]